MPPEKTTLGRTQEVFDFLQGTVPEGYKIPSDDIPRLGPDQAWTVVWYLQNLYWKLPDHIERCSECGDLYDANCEGGCNDGDEDDVGDKIGRFCGVCWDRCCLDAEQAARAEEGGEGESRR